MQWLRKRLTEKSTWVGLVTVAAAVYTGPYAGIVGQAATLVLGALGGGLAAATTKREQ